MKNKLRFLLIVFLMCLINVDLFATAQRGDEIVIGGKSYDLFTNPLESLFFKKSELKEKFDKIYSDHNAMVSSNCWRGYVAKFKIIDDALYIVDITIDVPSKIFFSINNFKVEKKSIYKELFETDKPMLCDFFSDMLIIPQGDIVEYVHGEYLSEYEKYILIKITDGKVIKKGKYSLEEYKRKKEKAFESFYKSEKYEICWNEIKDKFVSSVDDESKKEIMKSTEVFYLYGFFEFWEDLYLEVKLYDTVLNYRQTIKLAVA